MKKVLFLTILPFLLLGTASVNAQVRIGGNTEPNPVAILDLNESDSEDGTKALALPRVSLGALTGDDAQLDGLTPLDGMIVYNTNSGLGTGLYYWVTDKWVKLVGSEDTLNVIDRGDNHHTVTAADDIILFTTTTGKQLTLPTTGITVGKKIYVSDAGLGGVTLLPNEALRDISQSMIWPRFPVTIMYIGNGKWLVLDVVY